MRRWAPRAHGKRFGCRRHKLRGGARRHLFFCASPHQLQTLELRTTVQCTWFTASGGCSNADIPVLFTIIRFSHRHYLRFMRLFRLRYRRTAYAHDVLRRLFRNSSPPSQFLASSQGGVAGERLAGPPRFCTSQRAD